MQRWTGFSLFAVLSVTILLAQEGQTGGQTGGATGGGAGAGAGAGAGGAGTTGGTGGGLPGGPGGVNTPGRFPTQPRPGEDPNNRFPDFNQNRPIFLQGKVLLDDGTAPSESVVIQRVCNGGAGINEGYTDSKGHFSIELGRNQMVMQDASSSPGDDSPFGRGTGSANRNPGMGGGFGGGRQISERDLMGCEIRAQLAGFRSDAIPLAGRRSLDNPNIGTIILRRMANVEGLTMSATTLMAPKDAKKAYEKGHKLAMNKKTAEAQKEFETAVALYPKYATAWYELGLLREIQNQGDAAMEAYNKSLEADAKFIKPYLQIAGLHARAQKWEETAATTEKAIKLNPYDFPNAYFYNAVANFNLQKIDEAEKSAREGVKLDASNRLPKLKHVLGVILAQKDDLPGAAENLKSYLKFAPTDAMAKDQLTKIEGILAQKASNTPPQ